MEELTQTHVIIPRLNHGEPKSLTVLHQNVDRITNQVERLNHFLQSVDPDLVVSTEHGNSPEEIKNTRLLNFLLVTAFGRTSNFKGKVAI